MESKELLTWSKELEIGIQIIDDQHKKLFDILNRLFFAYDQKKHKSVIGKTIEELVDYTKYHFKTEEDFFNEFNYKESDAHIKEHNKFITTISDFVIKFSKYDVILTLKILIFLKNWVKNHIHGTDRKYIECFKENGI